VLSNKILFPAKTFWCTVSSEPVATVYTVSDTGSMKKDLMMTWFNLVLLPSFPPLSATRGGVLTMDGFAGHLSLEFLDACAAHHIHVMFRYPHSSHRTQVSVCWWMLLFSRKYHVVLY
jgi:hypothetical protein